MRRKPQTRYTSAMTQTLPSTPAARPVRIASDGTVVVTVPDFDPARAQAEIAAQRLRTSLSGLWVSEQDEDQF